MCNTPESKYDPMDLLSRFAASEPDPCPRRGMPYITRTELMQIIAVLRSNAKELRAATEAVNKSSVLGILAESTAETYEHAATALQHVLSGGYRRLGIE